MPAYRQTLFGMVWACLRQFRTIPNNLKQFQTTPNHEFYINPCPKKKICPLEEIPLALRLGNLPPQL